MKDRLLILQLAKELRMDSEVIAKDANYDSGRDIVHFPELTHLLGECYFTTYIMKEPLDTFLQLVIDPENIMRHPVMKLYSDFVACLPYSNGEAFGIFFIHTQKGYYVMYRGYAYDGSGGIFFKTVDSKLGYIIEPFKNWLSPLRDKEQ